MLFEAATEAGAILADATDSERDAMRLYGRHLGIAFQIVDDLMDYLSDSETMGKNVGDDLAEGKATLPLIYAMRVGSDEERKLIRHAIREGGLNDLQPVMEIVQRTGAIDYTRQQAQAELDRAVQALEALPASSFRDTLITLTEQALDRTR
jgi:octaprenyl-diphosphate synthase